MSDDGDFVLTSRLHGVSLCAWSTIDVTRLRYFEFFLCFPGDVRLECRGQGGAIVRDAPLIGLASDWLEAIRELEASGRTEVYDIYVEYRISMRAEGAGVVICEFNSWSFVVDLDRLKYGVSAWATSVLSDIESRVPGVLSNHEYPKVKRDVSDYLSASSSWLSKGEHDN